MARQNATFIDRLLTEAGTALRTVAAPVRPARPSPAADTPGSGLLPAERERAARLMRVNHAGEIAAQALYRGQALVAREHGLRAHLLEAAAEEHDHLAWCRQRVSELGRHTSRLDAAWYAGAFAMGAAAGLVGDRFSLSFLAETERQVAEHLDGHLAKLPAGDEASRRIIGQMHDDEVGHGREARRRGAAELPGPLKTAMRVTARVMTTLAFRV